MEHDVSELLKDCENLHSSSKHSSSMVFPPTDHENLHISPSPSTSSQSSAVTSPSSSLTSSQSSSWSQLDQVEIGLDPFSGSESRIRDPVRDSGWFNIGLEVFWSRAIGVVSKFRDYAVFRCPFWSFHSAGEMIAAFVVLLSLWKWVRRRRVREDRMDRIMLFLKERDEKIIQLLQQIAKTNELLLARDRGVPK